MIRFCTVFVVLTVLASSPTFAHAQASPLLLRGTPKATIDTPSHKQKYTASLVVTSIPGGMQGASVNATVTPAFTFRLGFAGGVPGKVYYLKASGSGSPSGATPPSSANPTGATQGAFTFPTQEPNSNAPTYLIANSSTAGDFSREFSATVPSLKLTPGSYDATASISQAIIVDLVVPTFSITNGWEARNAFWVAPPPPYVAPEPSFPDEYSRGTDPST